MEMNEEKYDVTVIGSGMIGSAAAKHICSQDPSLKVCLIGPSEPKSKSEYRDQKVLAAYYDEGRLYRQLYTHPGWAILAKRAAQNYTAIENESGITFHKEVGCLTILEKDSTYMKLNETVAREVGITYDTLSDEEFKNKYPYIFFQGNDIAWLESKGAGYVNPRLFVRAEQVIAKKKGCSIIDDVVTYITEEKKLKKISMQKHAPIYATKILVATGAFTEFYNLLPKKVKPEVGIMTNTVILAELSDNDQQKMRNMPSMMYNGRSLYINGDNYLYTYILPPIKYPDGKVYLKIGHMDIPNTITQLNTLEHICDHYDSTCVPYAVEFLTKIMNKLFPNFKPVSLKTDSCVTTHTPSGYIYIDMLDPQCAVAIGGNGTCAKNCDEVGKMAAKMLLKGGWDYDLPHEWFKFQERKEGNKFALQYAKL